MFAQIGLDPFPDDREHMAEREHFAVFRFVAYLAPTRVIAILLAAALVASDRLDMAVRVRADPHRTPRSKPAE